MENKTNTAAVALIALCHEYCVAVEQSAESTPTDFCTNILRLLPRIYMTMFDFRPAEENYDHEGDLYDALEEERYYELKNSMAALLGEHDAYLDIVVAGEQYSEEPVASSVSEKLADLYQIFYIFIDTLREALPEVREKVYDEFKSRFRMYWSEELCDAMRIINYLVQNEVFTEE